MPCFIFGSFVICRAVNNQLLDTYQLKTLDGLLEATISETKIIKENGKLQLSVMEDEQEEGVPSEEDFDNFATREPYDRIIRCLGFQFDTGIFNQ